MEYSQINGYGGYNSAYNTNGGRGVNALYNGAYGYPTNYEDFMAPQRDFKGAWTVNNPFFLVAVIRISSPTKTTI